MSYNTTKVKIHFGGETLEVEGSVQDVKDAQKLFFENVLELQKIKQNVMIVGGKEPNMIFKDHH